MDFGCVFGSLGHGRIPRKDCLLPLISKLLGYCIVAGSTTVKIPQVYLFPVSLNLLPKSCNEGGELFLAGFGYLGADYLVRLILCRDSNGSLVVIVDTTCLFAFHDFLRDI